MFVEKLNNEKIKTFVKQYGIAYVDIDRIGYVYMDKFIDENKILVKGHFDGFGPHPTFKFNDFSVKVSNVGEDMEKAIQKDWRKYLYNTFGENYKKELANYLDNNRKDILNSLN